MLPFERAIIDWIRRHRLILCFLFATLLSLLIRCSLLNVISRDITNFLLPWFDEIRTNGGLRGLNVQVGNYNIAYQFIIALLTYLPGNPTYLIKFVSIAFDYLLALSVGKLAFDASGRKTAPFVYGYALTLLLPTVFLNSAAWGQCDSIYTTFCVLCVDLLILHAQKPAIYHVPLAFAMLGVAFAFKLQAVLILPFIMYLYFSQGNFSLLYSLIPIAMNVIIPVVVGRKPLSTFWVYSRQAGSIYKLSYNSPSIWLFLTQNKRLMYWAALLLTLAIFGLVLVVILRQPERLDETRSLLYLLIWSCWTCIMFLPGMHDRYSYIVEVLFIALALMDARALPFAAAVEITGMAIYGQFLFDGDYLHPEALPLAMFGCVITYLCFSMMLYRKLKAAPHR